MKKCTLCAGEKLAYNEEVYICVQEKNCGL